MAFLTKINTALSMKWNLIRLKEFIFNTFTLEMVFAITKKKKCNESLILNTDFLITTTPHVLHCVLCTMVNATNRIFTENLLNLGFLHNGNVGVSGLKECEGSVTDGGFLFSSVVEAEFTRI